MKKIILGLRQKKDSETVRDVISALISAGAALMMSLWAFRENLKGLFKNSISLGGDGLLTSLYIQTSQNSGFWDFFSLNIFSTRFGWPNALDFSSYPMGSTFELFVIRIFSNITKIEEPSQLIHLFSVAKAGPIAISAFILARVFGLSRIPAGLIGVVYSLSTFNLIRAEGHFFLGMTWSIPLGIAAIFIAFKLAITEAIPTSRDYIKIFSLALLSFLTGYYYSFFLIIISGSMFLLLVFSKILGLANSEEKRKIRSVMSRVRLPFYVASFYVIGLFLQTVPVLIRSGKILSVTGLADRSPIESVIYAGTPESFFYDFYSLVLKLINRPDLNAFLQTRISWEASQLSSLTGIIFILIILISTLAGILKLFAPSLTIERKQKHVETELIFVILVLILSLALYFTSPINFGISRLFPQIRAWGRLSVVITLMSLILLGIFLKYIKRYKAVSIFLTSLLVAIPATDVLQFRHGRPLSSDLNAVSLSDKAKLNRTAGELQGKYREGCSLVNLPIYPFPEFDLPVDKNIDYGLLQLPLSDEGYFKWSYAGVKATSNFSVWQPLVSEFPPFQRASIDTQIEYSSASGACGAVVDRSFLTSQESSDLEAILRRNSNCTQELGGAEIDSIKRYVLADFSGASCKYDLAPQIANQFITNSSGNFVWRIDQLGSERFDKMWQIFSSTSPIKIRIKSRAQENKLGVSVLIKVNLQDINKGNEIDVCLKSEKDQKEACSTIILDAQGIGITPLPATFITENLEKFDIAIKEREQVKIVSWGVVLVNNLK
jgi:hypothetical protein